MTDKYNSFSRLAEKETLDKDYVVRLRERRDTTVVIAPHGGGIEPGTSELACAIAGEDLSFYAFKEISRAVMLICTSQAPDSMNVSA